MSTENRVRWEAHRSYEDLEAFMAQARKLRSQAVCGMTANLISRLGGVFGNLAAPLGKTTGPALPTTGKARLEGPMRTNISVS